MGKTFASAKGEVAKCAKGCRYYADHAEEFSGRRDRRRGRGHGAARAYVRYQPIGAVLAIMPWNFPLWQAMRFAAPALWPATSGC